ncbi:uncharacterized protein LOC110890146 [Helianthus annuus]|uniref:uncharacterized protein LOC110890146 n=1 Tax=Helianthus annuus TaxID=4232 RepID=UPI000B8F7C94|nr:uncharacterized protein LOC110890146 [Helianthus annuus]
MLHFTHINAPEDVALQDLTEQGTVDQASDHSSYEDSEGEVNSPGESEDDDILGKKHKVNVPVTTECTDWTKWEWVPGTRFVSREAFKAATKLYAVANGRDLKISISDKKRHGRIGVSCSKNCPFKVYATSYDRKGCYLVRTVTSTHTSKEIQDAVKEKYKVIVNNWFAYNTKRSAHRKLHGSMKEHYCKMGSYLEALRVANPASTFELLTVPPQFHDDYTSDTEVFFRLFVCFDGVKQGFLAGCRRLLCLDGCFLKTFLGGMLLAAIGRDANDQMFPLAWAMVEGENTLSWTWFMQELKKCLDVTDDGNGWTLVSDQQKGLLNAVASHWTKAEHRNCAMHIYANWHKKHKGDELKEVFWKAVRAYCEPDFKDAIEEMKELLTEASEAFIKQNPRYFCRCYLSTDIKSDVVVSNMAETFNGFIIKSRSKHIINMLEDIRLAIMTRLARKKMKMLAKTVTVCPRIQLKLDKEKDKAWRCEVFPSNATLFQVKGFDDVSVDIENKSCSCRKWDLTGLPCYHMCAVASFLGREAEEFVHESYKKEMYLKAYDYIIPPLPSEKYWPVVDLPLDPPPVKIGPGRPKKNRKKDPHENPKKPGKLTKHGMTMTCSGCGSKEHNKRRCPEKGKVFSEPKRARGRGRPRKDAAGQVSTPVDVAGTKRGKGRGRPRKVTPSEHSTQQSTLSTQQPSQGVVHLA